MGRRHWRPSAATRRRAHFPRNPPEAIVNAEAQRLWLMKVTSAGSSGVCRIQAAQETMNDLLGNARLLLEVATVPW